MPRLGRYFLPDQPQHVIQRGNDRQAVFFSDEDREAYLAWLLEAARKHGCAIHAYVLMTNHVRKWGQSRFYDCRRFGSKASLRVQL